MDHSQHPRPRLWAERNFDYPKDLSEKDMLMHHLSTFPSQCSIILEDVDRDKLTVRLEGKWSIQEHLGHLLDLEELASARILEIMADKDILTPADMSNKATWDKDYNAQNIYEICERFMQRRAQLVELFNSVPESKWQSKAYHERLDRKMSILDLLYFHGQHDQYHQEMMLHLASIT